MKANFLAKVFDGMISRGARGKFQCHCVAVDILSDGDGDLIAVEGVIRTLGYEPHWQAYEGSEGVRMVFITGPENDDDSYESLNSDLAVEIVEVVNQAAEVARNAPAI